MMESRPIGPSPPDREQMMSTVRPTVADVMSHSTLSVDLADPPSRVFELLQREGFRHLPVLDGGRLVGVISALELERIAIQRWVRAVGTDAGAPNTERGISELMTLETAPLREQDSLQVAGERLADGRSLGRPVLDDTDQLVGLLTVSDLARWIASNTLPAPGRGDASLVSAWMTHDLECFSTRTTVREARARSGTFQHLPLVADGLTGFLHRSQLNGVPDHVLLGDLPARAAVSMAPDSAVLTVLSRLRASSEDVIWLVADGVLGAFTEHDACRYASHVLPGRGLVVERVASPAPETIRAEATAKQASEMMLRLWIRHLPVLRNNTLIGVLSWRDLQGSDDDTLVQALIAPSFETTSSETPVEVAARHLVDGHLGALAVVGERGLLEGILTRVDVMRALLEPLGRHAG